MPGPSPVPPPAASEGWTVRSVAILCYALFLLACFNGVTALIAAIIAFVKRSDATGSVWQSHFQNMLTVFGAALLMIAALILSMPVAMGSMMMHGFSWPPGPGMGFAMGLWFLGLPAFGLWYLYRMVRGLVHALEDKPY